MKYVDFTTKSNSAVRKYFLWDEKGQTVMCKLPNYKKTLKFGGGSTKGLHIHMLSVHNVKLESPAQPNITGESISDKPPKKKSNLLTEYFSILEREDKTLHATLACLTAPDRLPFNVICFSTDLCATLTAMGFRNLATSVNKILNYVIE